LAAEEDEGVDLLGDAERAAAEEQAEDEQDDADDDDANDEPEDDFNAAWEVLDVARTLFEKRASEDDKIKLKLADTYLYLGDISLETG